MTILTRSAVLELLEPRAVEAVTGRPDAADRLEALAAQNLFIQAVGRDGRSFRYHKLLRDFLLAELERREPGMTVTLHRSAATWAAGAGAIELAIHHDLAAGDRADAAQLVATPRGRGVPGRRPRDARALAGRVRHGGLRGAAAARAPRDVGLRDHRPGR